MSNGNGQLKIEQVAPVGLRDDPELDRQWPLEPVEEPSEAAFVEDIRERGVLMPLLVSPDGKVVWDGRRRLRAAKRLAEKVKTVPVIRCRAEDRLEVIMASLMHRRHLSESARIYRTYHFWRKVRMRRVENLRNPLSESESTLVDSGQSGLKVLAQKWGVNEDNFGRCDKVLKLFAEHPDLKAEWEPKLLSGKVSLRGLVSGFKGLIEGKRNQGKTPEEFRRKAHRMAFEAVKTLAVRLKDFESLNREETRAMPERLAKYFSSGPQKRTAEQLRRTVEAEQQILEWLEQAATLLEAKGEER